LRDFLDLLDLGKIDVYLKEGAFRFLRFEGFFRHIRSEDFGWFRFKLKDLRFKGFEKFRKFIRP
jgi:hypothetical protein